LIERTTPDQAWDLWLERAGDEGDFLQTSRWAEIDEAANGVRSHVLRASAGIAGLVGHPAGVGGELRCLHGPVLTHPGALDGLADFALAAEALARERRCVSVQFVGRPAVSKVDPADLVTRLSPLGYASTSWLTGVVDLRRSDEQLLAAGDRAVGKALRRCEREGVSIRFCDDAESYEGEFLAAFAAARPDYDPERGRRAFALDEGRHYRYYVAVDGGGVVLATLGTYRFGGVATEIMSVRTDAGREHGAPAQDLLHWHVMREHRDLGDSWFDLAGYAASPATPAEAGIKRFKQKWGGREIIHPVFTKLLESRARRAARRLLAGVR
jgi:hypothetical protein